MVPASLEFDVETGFAVLANSATASLNNRKEFLDDLGMLNRIGRKQHDVRVGPDGEVTVAGTPVSTLDSKLREQGYGALTVLPTSAFVRTGPETFRRLSTSSVAIINPHPIPSLMGDKAHQFWELYDEAVPVPPWQPIDHYLGSGVDPAVEGLRRDFISDAPLVLKVRTGTQGQGIWFYPDGIDAFGADWRDGTAPQAFLDAPERFLLQYAVPHVYDKRVIAAGPTPVAAENRYGSPDTDRSNLNLVDTDAETLSDAARDLLARGAVEAVDMSSPDPALTRAIEDLYSALGDVVEPGQSELHTWLGWDLFVVDPDDSRLDTVPEAVRNHLFDDRYRTRDGCYLVYGEGNLSPGSKERYVNALANGPEGLTYDSAANLFAYGHSISQRAAYEPGMPERIDRRTLARRYGYDTAVSDS